MRLHPFSAQSDRLFGAVLRARQNLNPDARLDYLNISRRAPGYIRRHGLLSFVAWLSAEGSPAANQWQEDFRELWKEVLIPPRSAGQQTPDVRALLQKADAMATMLYTYRVLPLLRIQKRYAEILLMEKNTSSGQSLANSQSQNKSSAPPIRDRVARSIQTFDKQRTEIWTQDRLDNPGLSFERYVPGYNLPPESRSQLLEILTRGPSIDCIKAYEMALNAQTKLFNDPCRGIVFEATTTSRLLIGLGKKGPMDFGFTFHPTFGTPMIPGSSLKGIASKYAREYGNADWQIGGVKSVDLFGGTFEGTDYVGMVDILDALWVPKTPYRSPYSIEILTPHHTGYYEGKGYPDGMESPVPVSYLSIKSGTTFRFFLLAEAKMEAEKTCMKRILSEALTAVGVGGKTRLGHGTFGEPKEITAQDKTTTSSRPQP